MIGLSEQKDDSKSIYEVGKNLNLIRGKQKKKEIGGVRGWHSCIVFG
jgi:hypothetical protein